MAEWIDAHPNLALTLLAYVLLAGLISWPMVRRPLARWWSGLFIATYGPSLLDNLVRLLLYRLGFELFVFALACVFGALGGWLIVLSKMKAGSVPERQTTSTPPTQPAP